MKLNEREQNLLFVLGIVAVAIVGFKFMLLPAKAHYNELQVVVQEKQAKEVEAKEIMAVAETIDADIAKAVSESKGKSRPFFKRAEVEYVHKWISMLAESNSLVVMNLDITEETLAVVPVYGNEFVPISYPIGDYYNTIVNSKGAQGAEQTSESVVAAPLREDDSVLQMDVTVSLSGTNVQLMNYVDYLSNIGKHIIVKNFAFSDRQSTDIQEAEVALTIYCINKDEEDIFKGYFVDSETTN